MGCANLNPDFFSRFASNEKGIRSSLKKVLIAELIYDPAASNETQ